MKSKTLLICFVVVSVVSLAVSSVAVLTTARVYNQRLMPQNTEATGGESDHTQIPDTSPPQSDTVTPSDETAPSDEPSENGTENPDTDSDPDSDTQASATPDIGVILRFSGGKLTVIDLSGITVYERTFDPDGIGTKELIALTVGMQFPDRESAMSAIYDLVS